MSLCRLRFAHSITATTADRTANRAISPKPAVYEPLTSRLQTDQLMSYEYPGVIELERTPKPKPSRSCLAMSAVSNKQGPDESSPDADREHKERKIVNAAGIKW